MVQPAQQDITRLLQAMSVGDREAAEHVFPLIHAELRSMADRYMGRQPRDHTLQTTALVNEAYLRLVEQKNATWQNRAHYLGVAAKAMRAILIDHARCKQAAKRGGDWNEVRLEDGAAQHTESSLDLLALDEALTKFAGSYPTKAKTVELRFFGGLSVEETARVLGVSPATVKRDWRMAKAWLKRELSESEDDE